MTNSDRARALVTKIEHGDETHRHWLRDTATPLIATALDDAAREAVAADRQRFSNPARDPRVPFVNPLWNRADAVRNAHLNDDANDHISALGAAFDLVDREARREGEAAGLERAAALMETERDPDLAVTLPEQVLKVRRWGQRSRAARIRALIPADPMPDATKALETVVREADGALAPFAELRVVGQNFAVAVNIERALTVRRRIAEVLAGG